MKGSEDNNENSNLKKKVKTGRWIYFKIVDKEEEIENGMGDGGTRKIRKE